MGRKNSKKEIKDHKDLEDELSENDSWESRMEALLILTNRLLKNVLEKLDRIETNTRGNRPRRN